jgi:hypothetical protein
MNVDGNKKREMDNQENISKCFKYSNQSIKMPKSRLTVYSTRHRPNIKCRTLEIYSALCVTHIWLAKEK